MEEGTPNDEPLEGELMPAPDRLWRHPAERGAEQAAANLAARRVYGRRWPSMLMSFLAGCTVVGMAWLMQLEPQTTAPPPPITNVIVASSAAPFPALLSFDSWVEDVVELNKTSVIGLRLGGNPHHEMAQAILLADDGHLITSAHSLLGADPDLITAVLPNGTTIPAQLVASDLVSGVAVLKVPSPELPPPTYGDSTQVLVRDRLVALAQSTDDRGELARTIDLLGQDHVAAATNGDLLSGLFRLSDDLNDAWAGSAILDEHGGIVAMVVESRTGAHYGIPTEAARRIAQQLIDTGAVDHKAWLGIEWHAELSDGIKAERGLLGGLLIRRVWDETPAARGGIVAGDIIVGAGSVNVLDRTDLRLVLSGLNPGDTLELRYSRVTPRAHYPDELDPGPEEVQSEIFTTVVTVGAAPRT